jgi:hypothetical protein
MVHSRGAIELTWTQPILAATTEIKRVIWGPSPDKRDYRNVAFLGGPRSERKTYPELAR